MTFQIEMSQVSQIHRSTQKQNALSIQLKNTRIRKHAKNEYVLANPVVPPTKAICRNRVQLALVAQDQCSLPIRTRHRLASCPRTSLDQGFSSQLDRCTWENGFSTVLRGPRFWHRPVWLPAGRVVGAWVSQGCESELGRDLIQFNSMNGNFGVDC